MATTRKQAVRETFKKAKGVKKLEPIWDLYRDGLTQGAIGTFLSCRHQFWLKYVMGYRNKAKAGATAFGSAFHDILAHTQHAAPGKKPLTLDQAVSSYLKSLGELSPTVLEETTCMLAQIKMLIELYNQRWEEDHASRTWLKREETFRFVYELPYNGGEAIYDIPLRGRWDGVFQRKKSGIRLHETKTKGRIDEEGIAKSLPFDTQTMLYSLAIERELKRGTPDGTCYDVIRNPQLRLKQGERTIDFVDRCREDVEKRLDWYFMRWEVTITKQELKHWETHFLYPVLCQIVAWWESIKDHPTEPWKSPLHFVNPGAFWSVYGRNDLFEAITSGQTFSLDRRTEPFPELVD